MLLRYFRSFYLQNYPDDMEQCLEAFAVFGALGTPLDLSRPLETLIETHILEEYGSLYNHIDTMLQGNALYHDLLHAVATGDRRSHSVLRRSRLFGTKGNEALDYLRRCGILEYEFSREEPPAKSHPKQRFKRDIERHRISHKLRFAHPFLRFWFYFVAPCSAQIVRGDYQRFFERFAQHHQAFCGYTFEALCELYLRRLYAQEGVLDSGSYWDRQVEIDLLLVTKKGSVIVGECKWTNHKTNKKELHRLLEKCDKASIAPDVVMLFTKRGFSNELLQCASRRLELHLAQELELLLEEGEKGEILQPLFN